MMSNLESFPKEGFVNLGTIIPKELCADLMAQVRATRDFSPSLFLTAEAFKANPQYKGVNPRPGRNLAEQIDLSTLESLPAFKNTMEKVLGEGYEVLFKKFVMGMPETWMPKWLMEETKGLAVANLGAYIRPEYRDVTYFHGIDYHQDIIDYPDRNADFITLYIYLEDTTEDTSPLHVIPQSHTFGATTFPHDLKYKEDNKVVYSNNGKSADLEYFLLTGDAGSVYFWHSCTLHGTKPHMTSKPRISLRYLLEKKTLSTDTLIDKLNANIDGNLSLTQTRIDLDNQGKAVIRDNIINKK